MLNIFEPKKNIPTLSEMEDRIIKKIFDKTVLNRVGYDVLFNNNDVICDGITGRVVIGITGKGLDRFGIVYKESNRRDYMRKNFTAKELNNNYDIVIRCIMELSDRLTGDINMIISDEEKIFDKISKLS